MKTPYTVLALFPLALTLATTTPAATPVPNTLLHSLFDPGTVPQSRTGEGYSVALDGNIAVSGAPLANTGARNSGEVKVYDVTTGALLHRIINPTPDQDDYFGRAVAISGTRIVVGAYEDDTGASDSGIAHVYDLASTKPTVPTYTLTNPAPAVGDRFGFAVAISGTRVVIGAFNDSRGATRAGTAYLYDLAGGIPAMPIMTITNPSPTLDDHFGISVAISGTRVVVGAEAADDGGTDIGSAYVYDLTSVTPAVPVYTLANPSLMPSDFFGYAVAVSDTRVVVGAYGGDTGAINSGAAYAYDLASATPTVPVVTFTNPSPAAGDNFGYTVAISGTKVVTASRWDSTAGTNAGIAYAYDLTSATPGVPLVTLFQPMPANYDLFGVCVAMSGTRVIIGSLYDDTVTFDTGSANV